MPIDLKKICLFRMVHIKNVEYILRNGMFTRQHPKADPDYINIGDTTLIQQRNDYAIKLEMYGNLGDYVPFYFGPLSPMLLNIKTGYRGIIMRPQSDIVYLCCNLSDIIEKCSKWCFTDGHAKNAFTEFFNTVDQLKHVDWRIVSDRYWTNTDDDFDRMRRKQAEFLVKDHVPVKCIGCIVVYNKDKSLIVQKILDSLDLDIPVKVNPENKFYY